MSVRRIFCLIFAAVLSWTVLQAASLQAQVRAAAHPNSSFGRVSPRLASTLQSSIMRVGSHLNLSPRLYSQIIALDTRKNAQFLAPVARALGVMEASESAFLEKDPLKIDNAVMERMPEALKLVETRAEALAAQTAHAANPKTLAQAAAQLREFSGPLSAYMDGNETILKKVSSAQSSADARLTGHKVRRSDTGVNVGTREWEAAAPTARETVRTDSLASEPHFAFENGLVPAQSAASLPSTEGLLRSAGTQGSYQPDAIKAPGFWAKSKALAVTAMLLLTLQFGAMAGAPALAISQTPTVSPSAIVAMIEPGAVQESKSFARADSLSEVIKKAQPSINLYIVGNLGPFKISDAKAEQIGETLRRVSPHGYFIVVGDASGEAYTVPDGTGRIFRDGDAYQWATEYSIMNRDGFQSQKHRNTQKDTFFFTMVLSERSFYYVPSEAQKAHGPERLNGNDPNDPFHQWARAGMRGGNLADAIINTAKNYIEYTNDSIAREAESAQAAVEMAAARVSELEKYAKENQNVSGAKKALIASSELDSLKRGVADAKAKLAASRLEQAEKIAQDVSQSAYMRLQGLIKAVEQIESAKSNVQEAANAISAAVKNAAALKSSYKVNGTLTTPSAEAWRQDVGRAQAFLKAENFDQANSLAQKVRDEANALSAEIDSYPNALARMAEIEAQVQNVRNHPYSSAVESMKQAESLVTDAKGLLSRGENAYASALDQAAEAVKAAQAAADQAQSDAEFAAAKARALKIAAGALALIWLVAQSIWFARARKRSKLVFDKWRQAMTEKADIMESKDPGGLTHLMIRVLVHDNFTGQTGPVVAQIRKDVRDLSSWWMGAKAAFAVALKKGSNIILGWLFPPLLDRAVKTLKKPVKFNPETSQELERLSGAQPDQFAKLYGGIDQFEGYEESFDNLMEKFNQTAERAVKSLKSISEAMDAFGPTAEKTLSKVAAVAQKKVQIDASPEGLFLAPSLYSTLLPAIESAVAGMKAAFDNDPLGALSQHGAAAERMAEGAKELSRIIIEEVQGKLIKFAHAATQALAAAGIGVDWISKEMTKTSGAVETAAGKLAQPKTADPLPSVKQEIETLSQRFQDAAVLEKKLREIAAPSAVVLADKISSLRAEIGEKLHLGAEKTAELALREAGADPSEVLAKAESTIQVAKDQLGRGNVGLANKLYDESDVLARKTQGIIDISRHALEQYEPGVVRLGAETQRLTSEVPSVEVLLQSIKDNYAESVLPLIAGDPTHPNADGTIENNIDEASEQFKLIKAKMTQAADAFRAAKLIAASDLLTQVKAHQETANHRLNEVKEKHARLEAAVKANDSFAFTFASKLNEATSRLNGDRHITQKTVDRLEPVAQAFSAAKNAIGKRKHDPLQAGKLFAQVQSDLQEIERAAAADIEMYEEADRSFDAAAAQIKYAEALSNQAENDKDDEGNPIRDSDTINRLQREVQRLFDELKRLADAWNKPHVDSYEIDREADRIAGEAARVAAGLKGELDLAEKAVEKISAAVSAVSTASGWSGSYASVSGRPGSGHLNQARQHLHEGRYRDAYESASSAKSAADDALAQAQAEDNRKRRAAEEAAEAARRKAERERREREEAEEERNRRSSYSSSSSGFGSGGFGSSSSSSGGFGSSGSSGGWGGGGGGGFTSSGSKGGW